ncbi:endonuclease/exonuclease/phosphatase family protein [Flammeovirga sp. EKP202]|uniref:endonuclease/exonuclease/phosphatase family protein n=1 Tax=Flammeovirga sp. EKP202 TaxID=2770592 RepID=UPI00165FF305|nr:endonuclease/exonuclease/phosphatase family protein [Flammeovirga sp. EKP202]MBD0405116.1 endonuclease/exonuclease/phosphatase family protein [Flammeovirga sp. EKP202]
MKQLTILYFLILFPLFLQAQKSDYKVYSVAFYNMENLFDTLHDEGKKDYEYLPEGDSKWTSQKYWEKQTNMSTIIAKLGFDVTKQTPLVIGLAEIENRNVLNDLVNTPKLKGENYGIAHIEGPDKRGVDVALLYKKDLLKVNKVSARDLKIKETYAGDNWEFKSRNQLIVEAELEGEPIVFLVNHWPSRRGESRYREEAGKLQRSIIDSLRKEHPGVKCITMGDYNDDPTNKSMKKALGAVGDEKSLTEKNYLFNPFYKMYKKGLGTLAYRDSWNLFDQIIFTKEFKNKNEGWFFWKAEICSYPELKNKEGRYKGYPYRTFAGGNYAGGYSDHFPVVIYLLKQANSNSSK